MKTRYLLSALALASASSVAQTTALTEAQMMQYTSKTSMATIGKRAELNLEIQPQAIATYSGDNATQVITQKVSHPNASYLKLHFKNISLAGGGKLVVRSEDGSERYEYTEQNMRAATLSQGDDGVTSFSAMSISADTAVVEYTPGTQNTVSQNAIIDYYDHGIENELHMAPAADVGISSTCGAMERKDVQCWASSHSTEFERSRPVARLLMNGSGLCTGWRVGPDNRMFTNNHCVESASELSNTEVWFNYQHTSCNGSTLETVVKVTGKDFLSTDYTLDYTLFTINDFAKAQPFGYFGLDVRNATQGERIYIPQHGSGNPKELSIESDRDTDGLCSVNNANANGRGTGTDLGYYCDTIGGSSGSPVLAASSNKVIALHHLGGCHNKGAKVSLIWPKVASHFNNQIPDGDNNSDPMPVADFSLSCNALSCSFDGSASSSPNGTISQYEWSYGDASSNGFGATVNHNYASYGVYSVSLTVTDTSGASATTSKQVTLVDPNNDPAKLINGVAKEGLSGARSDTAFYYLDLPAGASNVTVSISGGSGDADLYVRKGDKPTTSTYDCRPYRWGNSETCNITGGAGKYWIMLRGYSAYSGVKLIASYTE
ncbi:PKD domain-containing protein [Pseudoalteromonas luteoviolacea]|uniref:PKD domain-containing protein n=1 Tax=Pseudoalteromonas luteoviolacea S4060-1 TaxID=1365257 RepID=A0A167M5S4_9GAMM|nr:PKD domain-containing protein [Pseudoalteromonas luteoviolacea]KZN65853.1 hypothetical protein N478_20700 [Pseudoalteromonas luteoviolacea S4060-1]